MMNAQEYKVRFYCNSRTGKEPVREYIDRLGLKDKAKVLKYIEFLRIHQGYLDEPYSKHVLGKLRELRVDFAGNRHRIFYFAFLKKKIILLHAFLKKTAKIPLLDMKKAMENYNDAVDNSQLYEQES